MVVFFTSGEECIFVVPAGILRLHCYKGTDSIMAARPFQLYGGLVQLFVIKPLVEQRVLKLQSSGMEYE